MKVHLVALRSEGQICLFRRRRESMLHHRLSSLGNHFHEHANEPGQTTHIFQNKGERCKRLDLETNLVCAFASVGVRM